MNRLNSSIRAHVISCLMEGCPVRSTCRVTGVSKKAVTRLLVQAGQVAAEFLDLFDRISLSGQI
jgi:transposase-like protein